jgi:hypothetical protein
MHLNVVHEIAFCKSVTAQCLDGVKNIRLYMAEKIRKNKKSTLTCNYQTLQKYNKKVKVSLEQATKAQTGSIGIALLFH